VVGFVVATVTGGRRADVALVWGAGAAMSFAWAAWWLDLRVLWGVTHGPELALWVAAVAVTLVVRRRVTGGAADPPGQ
jgi:hypothetical protein